MKQLVVMLFLSSCYVFLGVVGINISGLKNSSNTKPFDSLSNISQINQDLQNLKEKFKPAKKLLLEKGVPFDPEVLLLPNWTEKVSSLNQMDEMKSNLRAETKLKGVQIADTIILPEKVELSGDTVIIANSIIFEGKKSLIKGLGKNIYVFPVKRTGHLGTTFEAAMEKQGFLAEAIPKKSERTNEKFDFNLLTKGTSTTIDVSGQGYDEWRERFEKNGQNQTEQLNELGYVDDQSVYQPGAPGPTGTPGDNAPQFAPTPVNGVNGNCRSNHPNGIEGFPGDNGETGGAGKIGGTGYKGGTGGTIIYTITGPPFDDYYQFLSNGGYGGPGGEGGRGGTGGRGQDGGKGGNGEDCTCIRGGSGSGADGMDGGRGGKGGPGGPGGMGGPGGDGGSITVYYPTTYDFNRIFAYAYGRGPGGPGPRGQGGFGGTSGTGGEKGKGATNFNCPSTQGSDGRPGRTLSSLGFGDLGEPGTSGTQVGETKTPRIVPISGGGMCDLIAPADGKQSANLMRSESCCSDYDRLSCFNGGGV
jgi:hypothetical protein